ncbi:hypothetical protein N7507_005011 [Penicillium longicatenatum]|nr:hypothetical protein N7507_005011 [Penicillium longicatenatum]
MYQRALPGYKKALGLDHISTLYTINNLRNIYKAKALAGYEKALSLDHISTLNTMNNLRILYQN